MMILHAMAFINDHVLPGDLGGRQKGLTGGLGYRTQDGLVTNDVIVSCKKNIESTLSDFTLHCLCFV